MNFLAHLYLSGADVEIRLGNFIGDYVKGKSLSRYPEGVQKGITLHRAIDSFTDKHSSTRECINLLRPGYGKYAGVVVDVLFDHVLANEWNRYSQTNLKSFTRSFYFQMVRKYNFLPDRVKRFLPFMIQSNRLYSYKTNEGLKRAIEIMSSVTSLPDKSDYAIETLNENHELITFHFNIFFPEMITFVGDEFGITLNTDKLT
jgi:acyl carrier protein phosphodiesterase